MADGDIADARSGVTRECSHTFDKARQEMLRAWLRFCAAAPDETQAEIDGTLCAMRAIAAMARPR